MQWLLLSTSWSTLPDQETVSYVGSQTLPILSPHDPRSALRWHRVCLEWLNLKSTSIRLLISNYVPSATQITIGRLFHPERWHKTRCWHFKVGLLIKAVGLGSQWRPQMCQRLALQWWYTLNSIEKYACRCSWWLTRCLYWNRRCYYRWL